MKLSVTIKEKSVSLIRGVLSRAKHTVTITPDVSKKITENFLTIKDSPYEYEKNFEPLSIIATDVLQKNLSPDVKHNIAAIRDNGLGYLEIKGAPVDPDLMDTPTSLGVVEEKKETFVAELFSMGLAGLIRSKVFNFRQEGLGTAALIFNIFPVPGREKIKGAGGVSDDFGFHMENGWHPQSPDYLILTGLRHDHDKKAITYCVANEQLLAALTAEEIHILKTHPFRLYPPEVHHKMELEKNILFTAPKDYVGPIIIEEKTGHKFMVNFNGMESAEPSEEADKALNRLKTLCKELKDDIKLTSGNALIINNGRALHTRNGYTPRWDGKNRWFQRFYLLDQEKLWPEHKVTAESFAGILPPDKAQETINRLQKEGILDEDSRLTPKFQPHKQEFTLPVFEGMSHLNTQILRRLMQLGPASPHRVI